ncbi:hypothetical protein IMCC14465_14740 [alpha proteobacterium IMCC14465]|uniref:Uncharacterized protein n=1 Tax=alpha proteobacterium IMCC14465 TaxID=1220535 RepID=J9DHV1_9PROT|nr:hypothetical protein IMCC14465_14740 [alpha proteobacterium IMCC14465]
MHNSYLLFTLIKALIFSRFELGVFLFWYFLVRDKKSKIAKLLPPPLQ